jgi:hypothetical protein
VRGPCLGGDRGAIGFHQSAILACEAFTQPINDRGQVMTRKNQNLGKVFGDRADRPATLISARKTRPVRGAFISMPPTNRGRAAIIQHKGWGCPQAPVIPMIKSLFAAAVMLGTTSLGAFAQSTVLTVGGPTGQYATISAAVAAADADTNLADDYVISVAPGTYTNDSPQITRPMTIQAAAPGSAVILNAPAPLANEKGIILTFANLTVDGLTLEGANIANSLGGNAAGIRAEMGNQNYTLTVQNTTFIGNQTGMLTDASFPLNVVLINNVFMNNGNPNPPEPGGTTHGIYIGSNLQSLNAMGNEFCGTNVGHDIKSRAAVNMIENNTIYNGAADPNQPSCNVGSSSFALDLPNGGAALVVGNTMIKGTAAATPILFAYGEEGLLDPTNSIIFIDNTMDGSYPGATGILDAPSLPIPVVGNGNTFGASIVTPVDPASADQLTGSGAGGISPDGSILTAPSSGSLTTAAGVWSFGTARYPTEPGQYQILLNGSSSVNGWAAEMMVADGGNLYVYNSAQPEWYEWSVALGTWLLNTGP